MARWLVLIVCGVFVLFALSGAACSWVTRLTDKPANPFERCSGDIREGECLNLITPKIKVGEKFLREKKQPARKAVV